MSDFEDDEDFGLGGGGQDEGLAAKPEVTCKEEPKPVEQAPQPTEVKAEDDEEEDIYGDIVAPSRPEQQDRPAPSAAPSAKSEAPTERQLALVERQNSGGLASSSVPTALPAKPPPAKPQRKGVLPKILADTTIVYVGELEWWTTDVELETICAEFGRVDTLTFFEDKPSGKSKGYCLVKFATKEAANMCRHQMHGMVINGRKCVVTFSNSKNATSKTQSSRQQMNPNPNAGLRGAHYNPQVEPGMGADFPPLPPWGMAGLPMPGGLAMPPFMDMGHQSAEPDYKRRRY